MGLFQYAVGLVSADGSRELQVRPWVDTGALYCQFPANLLTDLGYQPTGSRIFALADGSRMERPFGLVQMHIGAETLPVYCVFSPEQDTMMLLGAIALEAFSLSADPVEKVLKPTIGMMLTLHPTDDEANE